MARAVFFCHSQASKMCQCQRTRSEQHPRLTEVEGRELLLALLG
jgi:hypothetical protein